MKRPEEAKAQEQEADSRFLQEEEGTHYQTGKSFWG